jgi:hypothetical protein
MGSLFGGSKAQAPVVQTGPTPAQTAAAEEAASKREEEAAAKADAQQLTDLRERRESRTRVAGLALTDEEFTGQFSPLAKRRAASRTLGFR